MASSSPTSLVFLRFGILFLFLNTRASAGKYAAIFNFGDSLSDTGNYLLAGLQPQLIGNLPYGQTYFHHPTGRSGDGRIILDFIAQAVGLPLVRPYLAGGGREEFKCGANFAVAGTTALDKSFFRRRGIDEPPMEYSLSTQMKWFEKLLPLLYSSKSGEKVSDGLSKSLIMLGEIGGNDYIIPLLHGHPINETRAFVPRVVKKISHAAKTLVKLGARKLVIPGISPLGCVALLLAVYQNETKTTTTTIREGGEGGYYDSGGCINWLNELSSHHNEQLQHELHRLRMHHPHVTFVYADYYGDSLRLYHSPRHFGFKEGLAACCGGEGPYNVSFAGSSCGTPQNKVCTNPSDYVCWDGVHLTEAAYEIMARGLLHGPYAVPPLI